jgi:hypothetical protein
MEPAFYLETAIVRPAVAFLPLFFPHGYQPSESPGSPRSPEIDFHADTLESSHAYI